jgi:hypothetical protein
MFLTVNEDDLYRVVIGVYPQLLAFARDRAST